jgi:DNA invertase Pin-like site-specific DNA recombinase
MVKIKVQNAVGYVRVSSDIQIDNTSIEMQIEKIKDYCKLYNIELKKVFIDEGQSGSNIDRKGYNEMIEYISNQENDINALIVYKADRLHRKLKNLLEMIEQMEALQIAFISITENFDTSTSQGMLFLQMIGSFSEFERKIINERTKGGRVKKASSEKFAGGRVPYGYKLINGDTLEIDPEEAKFVKQIFEMRKDGMSLSRIAKEINESGSRTKNGKEWNKQAIDYVLKNETYTGSYTYDGEREKNSISFKIPKIVSKQLYNKVNGDS